MTSRFDYHNRIKKSLWPTLFKLLGRTLFDTTHVIPSQQRVDEFEKNLQRTDELADQVVKDLFENPANGFRIFNKVLENGIVNDDTNIPESLRKLIVEAHQDPEWLDRNLVEKGAEVCRRLGGDAMAVLGDLALLGGYSNPELTKPLLFTGALKGENTFDRISETSQFWVDITREGALEKNSIGFKSAIRVRLMHAFVRNKILKNPNWESHHWGMPINKADSLATNVGFSMAMIYGCKVLGYHLPNDDMEAVLHLWRYVGYLMGDDVDWLPTNAEQGLQCLLLIHLSNKNIPDEPSIALANDYLNSFMPKQEEKNIPKYISDYLVYLKHLAYAQYLIPFDLYKNLKIPSSKLTWLFVPLVGIPINLINEIVRVNFPTYNRFVLANGGIEQEQIIKMRMKTKKATYIPK